MDSTARRRATRLGIGIQIPRQEGVANQALLGRQYSIPAAVACFLGIALVRLRSSTCWTVGTVKGVELSLSKSSNKWDSKYAETLYVFAIWSVSRWYWCVCRSRHRSRLSSQIGRQGWPRILIGQKHATATRRGGRSWRGRTRCCKQIQNTKERVSELLEMAQSHVKKRASSLRLPLESNPCGTMSNFLSIMPAGGNHEIRGRLISNPVSHIRETHAQCCKKRRLKFARAPR